MVHMVNFKKTLFTSTVAAGKPANASKYAETADAPQEGRLGGKAETRSVDRTTVTNRFADREKIEGVVQETVRDYGVTDRARKVENPAGIEDLAAEAALRGLEDWKQSMELTALSQQVQNTAAYVMNEKDTLETQHLTQGASAWADASPLGAIVMPADFRPSSDLNVSVNSVTDFTEANMRELMKDKSDALNGDCDSLVFCTPDFQLHVDGFFDEKAVTSGYAHLRSFQYQGGSPDFKVGLKSYTTSFGTLTLNHTRLLNGTRYAPTGTDGKYQALTGTTVNTNTTITVNTTRGLQPYMRIKGTGVPAGAYIASITDATHIVISAAATASGSDVALTVGRLDHALFLEMKYFQKKLNGGIEDHDLSIDGSGTQGFVKGFYSIFCGLGTPQAKVYTA